jgi:hypothetical protein
MSRRSARRIRATSRRATTSRISAPKVPRRNTVPAGPTRPKSVVASAAPHWTEEIDPSTIAAATAGLPRIPVGVSGSRSVCAAGRATLPVSWVEDIEPTLASAGRRGDP